MTDEVKAVEAMTEDAATQQGVETSQSPAPVIDYAAELSRVLEENEKIESDKENYKRALLKAKGKLPEEPTDIDAIAEAVAKKLAPTIEATAAKESVNSLLNQMSDNPKEKELIMHLFKGMDESMGSIQERMENAKLLANKKAIQSREKELQVALRNRTGLSSNSMGSGSEGTEAKTSILSPEVISELKNKGWDDKKIKLLEKNYQKNNQR